MIGFNRSVQKTYGKLFVCFVTERRKKASLLVEDLSNLSRVSRTLLSEDWNVLEGRRAIRDLSQSAQGCCRLRKNISTFQMIPTASSKAPTTPFKKPLCHSEGSNVLDDPPTTASSRTSPTSSLTFCRILNNHKFPGTPIASLKALADLYSLSHSPYSPLKEP